MLNKEGLIPVITQFSRPIKVVKTGGILALPPLLSTLALTLMLTLTGCGFQLRGLEGSPLSISQATDSAKQSTPSMRPMQLTHHQTRLYITNDRTDFALKRPLVERLSAVGVSVIEPDTNNDTNNSNDTNPNNLTLQHTQSTAIKVSNVRFQRYKLVGILTEIQLVISADVSYQVFKDGKPVTISNPIQVQHSYQYNEASVSTEDQQGEKIRDWLYGSLAQRIADQYVALNLKTAKL